MILALFTVLLWIIIIDNLLLGIFLLIKAYQAKFNNLYSIGFAFVIFFVALFCNFILGFGYFFQEILTSIAYLLVAIFTYLTFNKEREDYHGKLILFLIIILIGVRNTLGLLIDIDINSTTRYFERIVLNCYMFLIFFWLAWASYSTFKRLKDRQIAPWIKTRYKTISIVSFLWPFHVIIALFVPWDIEFGDPSDLISIIQFAITVILSLVFIIGMSIAWIIPTKLKNYLNRKRGYKPFEGSDLSEDELMKLVKDQLRVSDNLGND